MYPLCRVMILVFLTSLVLLLLLLVLWLKAIALLIIIAVIAYSVKHGKRALNAYGTARYATEIDLGRAGMFGQHGITIGTLENSQKPNLVEMTRRLLTLPPREGVLGYLDVFPGHQSPQVRINPAHLVCFSPTGGGKTTGLVVPLLLESPDPMVVLDVKGELFKLTSYHRRAKFGSKIVALDPFKKVTDAPDSLNPLDFIGQGEALIDDARALAEALVIRSPDEKEPHWADSAENMITATIIAVAVFIHEWDRSLQTVREVLSNPVKYQGAIHALQSSERWNGLLQRIGSQLTYYQGKELNSVLTSTNRFLRFLDSPAIFASTEKSTFDPRRLEEDRMTVYLVLPPEHLRSCSALTRMWLTTCIRSTIK